MFSNSAMNKEDGETWKSICGNVEALTKWVATSDYAAGFPETRPNEILGVDAPSEPTKKLHVPDSPSNL
jgi:hypothetical protein